MAESSRNNYILNKDVSKCNFLYFNYNRMFSITCMVKYLLKIYNSRL